MSEAKKVIMLGNEAIARGAYEAGVKVSAAYPGTPSTCLLYTSLVAKEEDLIKNLNPKIIGWKNYYSTKTNEKWMQALDWYIICTFTRWYNKKHQSRNHMSKVGFVRNSI